VVAVVSQPDRPRGRGRHASASPVSEVALRARIPLLQPERVGDAATIDALRAFAPDLGVVVAFGQFLPKVARELPSLGYTINGHASLLPKLRGAAPIAHAILGGERETGISVMRVEREMDAGAVALVRRTRIGDDETTGELEARLALLCADALAEAIDSIAEGTLSWTPQDASAATFAPKIDREQARLDFSRTAVDLVRVVRAFAPRPGAFTLFRGEPLRILAARALPGLVTLPAGAVRREGAAILRIATRDGWLEPTCVQRAGGRVLAVSDFLRGCDVHDGESLGLAPPAA
jgi:methionyl-tRNA formyltransferase